MTTNIHIQNWDRVFVGGIDTQPAAGETRMAREVNGPELVPMMNRVKQIALNSTFVDVQVDVLIDRSRQLGLEAASGGLNEDQFETLGPGPLNSSPDGSPSTILCPNTFRFISVSEKGPFRDLLLLPDAVSYIANLGDFSGNAFDRAKSELESGTPFWMWPANLNK